MVLEPVLMYYNHMTIYKSQKVIQCMLARNWIIWGFRKYNMKRGKKKDGSKE